MFLLMPLEQSFCGPTIIYSDCPNDDKFIRTVNSNNNKNLIKN
jgi:hypothetical protein